MSPADTIDTPILTAGNRGWAGVTNRVKPALAGDDQLTVLVNGRLDDTGSVQLRPGTEWLGRPVAATVRGMAYYDVPDAEAALVLANGAVWELPADRQPVAPAAVPGVALAASGRCESAQIVDKLAIADGTRLLGLWRNAGGWQALQVAAFSDGSILPPVQHVLAHAFRLFICGGRGVDAETVYGSDVLDPWKISNTIGVRVGRGEGDPIVALRPGPGQKFFALKGASCWWVDTTGSVDQWQCDSVTMALGCWAGATAVAFNQDVLFLSRRGVAQLGRLSNDAPVAPADLLSGPIQATIDRINWSAARRTACATLWNEYYLLAVPLDGAHRNNAILAYNTRTQQWSGEWTGLAPAAFCRAQFDGQTETLIGTTDGDLLRLDAARTTDGTETAETAIPLELETRAYDFDAADLQKIPHALDCEWRGGAAMVDISLRADGGAPQMIRDDFDATPAAGTANRPLVANLRDLAGGRNLLIRMVTAGGAFGLRELTVKALPLRARWEPPPAELLVPPVPADDTPGTPTTLIQADGSTTTIALQEIDTITLPHDSLDFVCFRGGLTVPAGSYVIAYRRGSFEKYVAPEVSDLPIPTGLVTTGGIETIAATWDAATDPRVVGWTVYVNGARTLDTATPSYAAAVPGGGTVALAVFSGAADGTLSATAATASIVATATPPLVPTGQQLFVLDDMDYEIGPLAFLSGGIGWAAVGVVSVIYDNPRALHDFQALPTGTITTISGGTGWTS